MVSDIRERMEYLAIILDLFPHGEKPSSRAAVSKYLELTGDIPLDEFKRCMDEAAAASKFFPTVAEVRSVYNRTRADNPTLALPTKEEAWGSVQRAIIGVGMSGTPSFKHPLVAKAVHNFGWRDLCLSENPEVTRSNFFRIWDELIRRESDLQSYLPETRRQLAANGVAGLIEQTARRLTMKGEISEAHSAEHNENDAPARRRQGVLETGANS